jgi:hemolysin activation/secretion protein
MRLIAFVDAGYARILDPLPEQLASDTLVSAGVGLTLRAYGHFNSAIDFAFPLSSPNALDASKREGVNALFRLWGEF